MPSSRDMLLSLCTCCGVMWGCKALSTKGPAWQVVHLELESYMSNLTLTCWLFSQLVPACIQICSFAEYFASDMCDAALLTRKKGQGSSRPARGVAQDGHMFKVLRAGVCWCCVESTQTVE